MSKVETGTVCKMLTKGEKEIEREPLGGLISNSISARVTLSVVTIGSEKKSSRFISSVT